MLKDKCLVFLFLFLFLAAPNKAKALDCSGRIPFFVTLEEGYAYFNHTPFFTYGRILSPLGPTSKAPFWTAKNDHPADFFHRVTVGTYFPWPYPICLPPWRFSISYEHFSDKFRSSYTFPGGVVQFPSVDGSVVVADFDITGTFGREYQLDKVEIDIRDSLDFIFLKFCWRIEPFLVYDWTRFRQRYTIKNVFEDMDLSTELKESLKTHYDDFGGGFALRLLLAPPCFSILVEGKLLASYGFTSFNGDSVIDLLPPVDSHISSHHGKWSSKYAAKAGLFYHANHVILGITGTYELWNYLPKVSNLQFDTGGAEIRNDFTSFYTVRLFISTPY